MATMTASHTTAGRSWVGGLRRYLRSPKGILLIVLGLLTAVALAGVSPAQALPNLASAMLLAALTDLALMVLIRGDWSFPSGALLTGLIVALVLGATESPYVAGLTAAIAIGSKYLFRIRTWNVFNPAALALVVGYFVFGSGESWWGALPDLPVVAVAVVLAAGVFIAERVNKLPMALVFLGAFFGLFAATAFLGDPSKVAEIFRAPDANAALFLALFMLDDPPTSPVRYRDQVVFGLIAALASYAIFMTIGAVYYLPAGVLVANGWETFRRLGERPGGKAREGRAAMELV